MKKNIIITAIAALLLSASCTQQDDFLPVNEAKTFTATIEQVQTKTTLVSDTKVDWCDGDEIYINNVPFKAVPVKTGVAEFIPVKEGDKLGDGPYIATYPATLVNQDAGGLCLESSQTYVPGRLNAPMMAISETEELSFRNICGVICLSLTGSDKITRVTVGTKSTPLWGPIEVNPETAVAKIVTDKGLKSGQTKAMVNPNEVYLIIMEGLQLNPTPTNLYVHLPEISIPEGEFYINIQDDKKQSYLLTAKNPVEVLRNNIYTLNINVPAFGGGEDEPVVDTPEVLPGKFTVDGSGKQVQFSCGNLQAKLNKSKEFNFANLQSKYIGGKNVNGSELATIIDLFGWSSTAQDNNFGIFTATENAGDKIYFDENLTFNEWGNNISDRDWFTLSDAEWEYLLFNRTITDFTYLFGKARINYTPGLLLVPDDFSEKGKEAFTAETDNGIVTDSTSAFPSVNILTANWKTLEDEGCVFLPCAGYRNSTLIEELVGRYWSKTSGRGLDVGNNAVSVTDINNFVGCSVRLVTLVATEGDNDEEEE